MSYSYDDVYVLYAWRDNRRHLVLTQGEGYSGTLTNNDIVKAPRFQLKDERGVIAIPTSGNPIVQLAVTRSNRTEDLLTCVVEDSENGIIYCPITKSLSDIAGDIKGEIRLITANAVTKFYGVDFYVFNGVSDSAAAQSTQFSDLVHALQKVINVTGGGTVADMDDVIEHGGLNPVASGIIYDYLTNDFQTYLQNRFVKMKYAHESHSAGYDADTNPVDEYNDSNIEGVYIDEATDLDTWYIIKNSYNARVGILFCAAVPNDGYGKTQIALYYSGGFKYRYKHSNGGSWDVWSFIELQKNKDLYNENDGTYFGISNDDAKYPSAKAVYQFIQANAQAIKDSVLLGYDSLAIDKVYNIHKNLVDAYLEESDYSNDPNYTISAIDEVGTGSEEHGRPNKYEVSVPSGGTTITFRDTVSGRKWSEAVQEKTYIQNLIPNRVYVYQILNTNGVVLKTGTAKGSGKVRMINAGGDTYNIRDIGGWDADGGTLRYGVIYRGGELNNGITITSTQQSFFRDALGVRDEIDLRSSNSSTGFTPTPALGIGVSYLNKPVGNFLSSHIQDLFNDEANYRIIADVIKRVAKNITDNKPMYIHCQAGADRTGMICLFIEAVCGVSQNDIDRDYELTTFSKEPKNGSWSRITRKRYTDNSSYYNQLKPLVMAINTLLQGNNFNDKVIRFLLRAGVSVDELNAIRFGLIEGNPSKIINPYSSVTITNTLTNVSNSNTSSSVVMYQPYEAELTVNNMCKLTSVTITMGGVDVTQQYYDNGKINIPIVTGNLVVSAEATQSSIITEGMIANGAVSENKIGNGAVTPNKLGFRAVKYVSDTEVDNCIDADTIYEVRTPDGNGTTERHTVICVPATYQRTQYLFAQEGGVQFRKALYSNNAWGNWSAWISLMPKTESFTVNSSGWVGLSYNMDSGMPSYANQNTKVDISLTESAYNQLIADGCTGLYVTTETSGSTPVFTLHAVGNAPTANITIQLTLQQIN